MRQKNDKPEMVKILNEDEGGIFNKLLSKLKNKMFDVILAKFFAIFKAKSPKVYGAFSLLLMALFYVFNDPSFVAEFQYYFGTPHWFPLVAKWVVFVTGIVTGTHTTNILLNAQDPGNVSNTLPPGNSTSATPTKKTG